MMMVHGAFRSSLFRNSIFLFLYGENIAAILVYDWARQTLDIINAPSEVSQQLNLNDLIQAKCQFLVKPSDSDGLSLFALKLFTASVWKRMSNGEEGVATWMLGNTVELNSLLSIGRQLRDSRLVCPLILGLDDDGNVLFKMNDSGVIFTVDLESGEFMELPEKYPYLSGYPFSTFYTPGKYFTCT